MNHRSHRALRRATASCMVVGGALAIAGLAGTPASAAPIHDPFLISGEPNAVLLPGGVGGTIDLTLTNPNRRALRLQTLNVEITAVVPAVCATSNFAVEQAELPGGPLIIPREGDVTLSELGLTVSQLPVVRMVETGVLQDECQGASVVLTYSGRALGPDRDIPGGGGGGGHHDHDHDHDRDDDHDHDHDHDGHDHDHDGDSGGGLPGTGGSGLQASMTVTGFGLLAAGIAGVGLARRRRGAEQ